MPSLPRTSASAPLASSVCPSSCNTRTSRPHGLRIEDANRPANMSRAKPWDLLARSKRTAIVAGRHPGGTDLPWLTRSEEAGPPSAHLRTHLNTDRLSRAHLPPMPPTASGASPTAPDNRRLLWSVLRVRSHAHERWKEVEGRIRVTGKQCRDSLLSSLLREAETFC